MSLLSYFNVLWHERFGFLILRLDHMGNGYIWTGRAEHVVQAISFIPDYFIFVFILVDSMFRNGQRAQVGCNNVAPIKHTKQTLFDVQKSIQIAHSGYFCLKRRKIIFKNFNFLFQVKLINKNKNIFTKTDYSMARKGIFVH